LLFEVPKVDIKRVPIATLAYLGDSVMELFYRVHFLGSYKVGVISSRVKSITSRNGQAKLLERVWEDLSEEERDVVKRAMNSKSAKRYGNDPLYRKSTGFEALIGYLYISGRERRIMDILMTKVERS